MTTVNLHTQEVNMQIYWQLLTMQYYLQRMKENIVLINSAPNATIVKVNNTTLFALAALYYGDATQWGVIANANGLTDPNINGTANIIIPPWNQIDTGGIP